MYPPELSRIAGFCTNSKKKNSGGEPPDHAIKHNCLSLYYSHNTVNHLKKLKTHTQISPPPPQFFVSPASVVCPSVCPSVCLSVCHTRRAMFRRRHMHSSECCHYFLVISRSNGLCMPYLKSPLLIIFWQMDVWKNEEKSLKTPWKCTSKVLEKSLKRVCHDLWELCYLKSPLLIIFWQMDVWKNEEKSLKTPWKCTSKVLEKSLNRVCHDLWELCYLKSPLLIIFWQMDVWKNEEKSLKTPWKCTSKVLEKSLKRVCHDLWELW